MQGDFSRLTFDRKKHYSAVLHQQGRVLLDADLNEEHAIQEYLERVEATDVIGHSGTPKSEPGFGLSTPDFKHLKIGPGRYYVRGTLIENEADVDYTAQLDLPSPPPIANLLTNDVKLGLVYVDVFQRHVTWLDDPSIRDVALGGPDTATRLRTTWQVRILPLQSVTLNSSQQTQIETNLTAQKQQIEIIATTTDESARAAARTELQRLITENAERLAGFGIRCDMTSTEWQKTTTAPTGRLLVGTGTVSGSGDPCDVPPGAGYLRGENQLYRVEIHSIRNTGERPDVTFKWSRENASVLTTITAVGNVNTGTQSGTDLLVGTTGRDDNLSLVRTGWVEYVDDDVELSGTPQPLIKVGDFNKATGKVSLDTPITVNFAKHPKLRRWEQTGTATANGVAVNAADGTWVPLESNLQVQFTAGSYRPGDFWLIPARAATGKPEFPTTAQLPLGVQHSFARLGFVYRFKEDVHVLLDCRKRFPPLTAIAATDVSYNNSACSMPGVRNVQEAIDHLCKRTGGGTCTLTATPGPGWQRVFDQVPENGDAQVCLTAGDFVLDEPVNITRKRFLKITGAGGATRLIARKGETTLAFDRCQNVSVSDLSAEASEVNQDNREDAEGLNGTLVFRSCDVVDVERVTARCGHAAIPGTTCILVLNEAREVANLAQGRGLARVRQCRLLAGHAQIGLMVGNAARIHVEDNVILLQGQKPDRLSVRATRGNAPLRNEVRRILVSDLQEGPSRGGDNRISLQFPQTNINFETNPELIATKFWDEARNVSPPEGVDSVQEAFEWVNKVADAVLDKPATIPRFAGWFEKIVVSEDRSAMLQGILVGGEATDEVRVLNNTIVSATEGIQIRLNRNERASSDKVATASGNTVTSVRPPTLTRVARGMLVVNSPSLLISNNTLRMERLFSTQHLGTDGMEVSGQFGKRMLVRENSVIGYSGGISIEPANAVAPALWMVAENLAIVRSRNPAVLQVNNVAP